MIKELRDEVEKIKKENDDNINLKFKTAKSELMKMKINVDNVLFCRLQKEIKKNNDILLNSGLSSSKEITMMRTLTQLNILPNDFNTLTFNYNNNSKENIYFLLSKKKAKIIHNQTNPFEFWKSLAKFNDLGK